MRERRVKIQWTEPARNKLRELPERIARRIVEKIAWLGDQDNPRLAGKALRESLRGYYSLRVGRYRAIYIVDEEKLTNGDVLILVRVVVVMVGPRKAGDRDDVYKLAERLIRLSGYEPPKDI
ncbi:MAG: type II toxin-antitoxin system RelE/ParE family toxin [Phycisphaerae bacterium]